MVAGAAGEVCGDPVVEVGQVRGGRTQRCHLPVQAPAEVSPEGVDDVNACPVLGGDRLVVPLSSRHRVAGLAGVGEQGETPPLRGVQLGGQRGGGRVLGDGQPGARECYRLASVPSCVLIGGCVLAYPGRQATCLRKDVGGQIPVTPRMARSSAWME